MAPLSTVQLNGISATNDFVYSLSHNVNCSYSKHPISVWLVVCNGTAHVWPLDNIALGKFVAMLANYLVYRMVTLF